MTLKLAQDIKKGDVFAYTVNGSEHGWVALTDAEVVDTDPEPSAYVRVRFIPDGGEEPRYFDVGQEIHITVTPRGDA